MNRLSASSKGDCGRWRQAEERRAPTAAAVREDRGSSSTMSRRRSMFGGRGVAAWSDEGGGSNGGQRRCARHTGLWRQEESDRPDPMVEHRSTCSRQALRVDRSRCGEASIEPPDSDSVSKRRAPLINPRDDHRRWHGDEADAAGGASCRRRVERVPVRAAGDDGRVRGVAAGSALS